MVCILLGFILNSHFAHSTSRVDILIEWRIGIENMSDSAPLHIDLPQVELRIHRSPNASHAATPLYASFVLKKEILDTYDGSSDFSGTSGFAILFQKILTIETSEIPNLEEIKLWQVETTIGAGYIDGTYLLDSKPSIRVLKSYP